MRTLFLTLLLSLAAAVAAVAQMPPDDLGQMPETDRSTELERKAPSVFHRPARATPAEQLAYAGELDAAGRLRKAIRQYRALVHHWHASPEAVEAQRSLAELLEKRGKYEQAFTEYQYLVKFFPGRFDYRDILDRQFRIANHVMNAKHGRIFFGGFKTPETAIPLFETIARNAPDWERTAEAEYLVGWIHQQNGDDEDAVLAFERVRFDHATSAFAQAAALGMADSLYALVHRYPRDEQKLREALSAHAAFLRDFPADPEADKIQRQRDDLGNRLADMYYSRAVFYDRLAKRPASALIAYRDYLHKFSFAEKADEVSARVHELETLAKAPAAGAEGPADVPDAAPALPVKGPAQNGDSDR